MRRFLNWIVPSLGLCGIALSLVLVFATSALASSTCQMYVSCPNGTALWCQGENCSSSNHCLACWDDGTPRPEPKCCSGNGNV